MTYTGAMVLPQNAVVLQKEEMRYLEGGKSWSTTITVKYKKKTYKYKVSVSNLKAAGVSAISLAMSCYGLKSSLSGLVASVASGNIGTATVAAAGIFTSVAGIGLSYKQLKSYVSVKKL